MNRLMREELAAQRKRYPRGCRVKLLRVTAPYCRDLKPGMMGTVTHVDDIGTIHVAWDCGSTLGVIYGVDSCAVVHSEGGKRND